MLELCKCGSGQVLMKVTAEIELTAFSVVTLVTCECVVLCVHVCMCMCVCVGGEC